MTGKGNVWWKISSSWSRMYRAVNIDIPSATSVRTATHSNTQLDHSQFTYNKIKCVHFIKGAALSKHSGISEQGLHSFIKSALDGCPWEYKIEY
jgi:hypothetical protein